jgi:hypothetical protein
MVADFAPRITPISWLLLPSGNPEENLGFAGRQLERRENLDAAPIVLGHGMHLLSC